MDDNISYLRADQAPKVPYSTIPDLLKMWAIQQPEKTAFIFVSPSRARKSITFGKLYENVVQFAKGLVRLGIKKGDNIGIGGYNTTEWLISTFGVQMAGACPLHFAFGDKEGGDIKAKLKRTGNCRMLIFDPGYDDAHFKIISHFVQYVSANGIAESRELPELKWVILTTSLESKETICTIRDLIYDDDENVSLPKLNPEDFAAIVFTSGSTGLQKAVPLSHFAILMNGNNWSVSLRTDSDVGRESVLYNDRPFFWIGGYPAWAIVTGGTQIAVSDTLAFTSMSENINFASKIIKDEHATCAFFITPILHEIVQRQNLNLKLRSILTGGQPVLSSCFKCIDILCDSLTVIYGASELGFAASNICNSPTEFNEDFVVGKPLPGVELKIVDNDGYVVQRSIKGELYVRTYQRFNGYINDEERSKKILMDGGWIKTDDCAHITKDGKLVITGRMSDVMQVSGVMVSPLYIESAMKTHPEVVDAVVFPIKDKKHDDDIPCAIVLKKEESKLTETHLKQFIRDVVGIGEENISFERQFVPKFIRFVERFPHTSTGKIDRKMIKEMYQIELQDEYSIDCVK